MNISEIKTVKKDHEEELLSLTNVIGVETGLKEVSGEETDELSIRVLVKEKVPESQLSENQVIPKTIKGVKTDVEPQGGEITIPPLLEIPDKERTDKWRPSPFGVSIGHIDITAGTQGTLVRKNKELYTLSNAHVKSNVNKGDIGDTIIQPGSHDGGTKEDKLELLHDYIPIKTIDKSDCPVSNTIIKTLNTISKILGRQSRFEAKTKGVKNRVDAAIGKPENIDNIEPYVLGKKENGKYNKRFHRGSREPKVGEEVWVSGRTLGYKGKETNAKVKSTDATIQVRYPGGIAIFENQVHIKSDEQFSKGGMSGSAVASQEDNKVTSLLFAGNRDGTQTYANNIITVERLLDIEVVDMSNISNITKT